VFLPCLFACRAANEIHRRLAGAVDALLFVLVAVARGNKSSLYVTHITLIAANKQPRSGCLCLSLHFTLSFRLVSLPHSKVCLKIAMMCPRARPVSDLEPHDDRFLQNVVSTVVNLRALQRHSRQSCTVTNKNMAGSRIRVTQ